MTPTPPLQRGDRCHGSAAVHPKFSAKWLFREQQRQTYRWTFDIKFCCLLAAWSLVCPDHPWCSPAQFQNVHPRLFSGTAMNTLMHTVHSFTWRILLCLFLFLSSRVGWRGSIRKRGCHTQGWFIAVTKYFFKSKSWNSNSEYESLLCRCRDQNEWL